MEALQAERLPPSDAETLEPRDDAAERLVFGLRTADGISLTGVLELADAWKDALTRLAALGMVEPAAERWRLTARGREVADAVCAELLCAG